MMYVICMGDVTCGRPISLIQTIDQTPTAIDFQETVIAEYGAPTCIDVPLIMVDEPQIKPYVPTIREVVNAYKKLNVKVKPQCKPVIEAKARSRLR